MAWPATQLRRGANLSSDELAGLLGSLSAPSTAAPCNNPTCRRFYDWSQAKGRPPRFCSKGCRGEFNRERRRLLDELDAYLDLQGRPGLATTVQSTVNTRVACLRMMLERYRPFESGRGGEEEAPGRSKDDHNR